MKLKLWMTSALVSAGLLSACSPFDLSGTRPLPQPSSGLGITPDPKGPKPFPVTNPLPIAPGAPTSGLAREADPFMNAPKDAAGVSESDAMAGGGSDSSNQSAPEEPSPVEQSAEPTAQPTASGSAEPTASPEVSASPELQAATNFFFFSYDDSASTAGVEQSKYALKNNRPVQSSWVRPWEFLSYENFAQQNLQSTGVFKVSMGLWQHEAAGQSGQTALDMGVHVVGPEITTAERRNLALTLVIDVSGSMNNAAINPQQGGATPSLLELVKVGLKNLPSQLKAGDVVNVVSFSTEAKVLLENWAYEGDASAFLSVVNQLATEGGTNLDAGLNKGYQLAQKSYSTGKINRVVMLTDAFANQGTVDPGVISKNTRINNLEGIYFSGLGFGQDFQEAFLNELTEAGKGTYFAVHTEQDAKNTFGERFMSLVNIAARDVRFRLDYPAQLKRTHSAAEQSSQVESEVDPIHFSYNTSQYFLEGFQTNGETSLNNAKFKLTIAYTDPVTGAAKTEVQEKSFSELLNQDLNNIKDARVITTLTSALTGKISPEQARKDLDELLKAHSSSLANEYKGYLDSWLKMKGL